MQVAERLEGAAAPSLVSEKRKANLAKARAAKQAAKAKVEPRPEVSYAPPKPAINRKLMMLEWRLAKTNDQSESALLKPARQCHLENYSIRGEDFGPDYVDVALMNGKTGKKKVPCNLQGIFFDGSDIEENNFTEADMRWCSFRGCDPKKLENNKWEGTDLRGAVTTTGKIIGENNTLRPWE